MSAPEREKIQKKKPERYNWTFLKHMTLVSYCDASQVFTNVITEYL